MITPARMLTALSLWGLLLILGHTVKALAHQQASERQVQAVTDDSQALARQGFRTSLDWLRWSSDWSQGLKEFGNGSALTCQVAVVNRFRLPRGTSDGALWLAPHSVLLQARVYGTEAPRSDLTYFATAVRRRPIFWAATSQTDAGPFECPLAPAPPGPASRLATDGDLLPGSYGKVNIGRGVRARLRPTLDGQRTYRFQELVLEPGARLEVASIRACPAVIYIENGLELQGDNAVNWGQDGPGQAAYFQVYGLGASEVSARDSSRISWVVACPRLRLERVTCRGAVTAPSLESKQSLVTYEDGLNGVPLQGLGPWMLGPEQAVTGTAPSLPSPSK